MPSARRVERVAQAAEAVEPHARRGRLGDPVRGGDGGGVRRPGRGPGRGRRDRGRARRAARRDQHDPLAGHGADLGRARPHRVAGGDRARRSPPRSWRCCATRRPWCSGRVSPAVEELAERTAAERGARLVRAPEDPGPELRLLAAGRLPAPQLRPRRTAAEAFLGELDPGAGRARWPATVASRAGWSGSPSDPPIFVDAAHNPDGAARPGRGAARGRRRPPRRRLPGGPRRQGRGGDGRVRSPRRWSAPSAPSCPPAALDGATAAPAPARVPAAELVAACEAAGVGGRGRAGFRGGAAVAAPGACAEPPEGAVLVAGSHYAIASGPLPRRTGPTRVTVRGFAHGPRRRLRTPLDDGPGRGRGRDRDPRLLRRRLPVRAALPLTGALAQRTPNRVRGRRGEVDCPLPSGGPHLWH